MRNLLLLLLLGFAGYLAYEKWFLGDVEALHNPSVAVRSGVTSPLAIKQAVLDEFSESPVESDSVLLHEAALAPIDWRIKSRARKLFEEWKLRNAGTQKLQLGSAYKIDMAQLVTEIKLMGPYTERGIKLMLLRVLPEFGVAEEEVWEVADGIWEEVVRDGTKRGHHRADR